MNCLARNVAEEMLPIIFKRLWRRFADYAFENSENRSIISSLKGKLKWLLKEKQEKSVEVQKQVVLLKECMQKSILIQ